jgi:hypothetical protein
MAVLRYEALILLAKCIGDAVPAIRGKICAGPAESPKRLGFPHLSINPIKFKYFPDQAAEPVELGDPDTTEHARGKVLLNVGRHEGLIQLRLGAQTARLRAELEEKILAVFLGREGSPGVLVTPIPKCHNATVAWELDGDEWENEKAFDKKWYSIMTVMAQLPALVTRGSVYSIEELRLTLTEDLSTPIESVPAEEQETVQISEDGTIVAAVGP